MCRCNGACHGSGGTSRGTGARPARSTSSNTLRTTSIGARGGTLPAGNDTDDASDSNKDVDGNGEELNETKDGGQERAGTPGTGADTRGSRTSTPYSTSPIDWPTTTIK